ncbi:pyruvate dehydrogenase (acetyl-transferring) E1 component subunit alpha [Limosilactobacillus secaliphilus]|uniref:Pyruvate dehydrogenase E1 component subunit alpha n=1 Tax=Limosilactobacillus secaliphilus TaxID=396268 RepID=A0A0R2I0U6_9LACO|nr:pyruvate dehydrogenase (acetyl-transferring) E1 component subunit alpha [Limosilactobacillus secaliphilus]KRN58770.1 pyruvate dehydrogenase (acetyl-transferring) E1 component, alpha subunit [Limosilactobacillus secaliphilus]
MKQLDFEALKHSPSFKPLSVLNEQGDVVNEDMMPDLTDEQLTELYKQMLWSRIVNDRATKLNRQGRLGFFAPTAGEEASQLGSNFAMDKGDFLLGGYRDVPQLVKHGLPLAKAFMWSKGMVNGNKYPEDLAAVPPQIIIGAQYVQTAGVALGLKKKGAKQLAYTYTGDGGTSQGDFYEGMNFAGSFKAPALFFVQDNLYAISVPAKVQTAAKDFADKAVAVGIPSIIVDGMDALAVYAASRQARDYIVAGNGPVMIETLTYRYGPHTLSGDDPKRYRTKEEEDAWHAKDPVVRMKNFLTKKGLWSDDKDKAYTEEVDKEIDDAMKEVESQPAESVAEYLQDEYEVTPPAIQHELDRLNSKEGK